MVPLTPASPSAVLVLPALVLELAPVPEEAPVRTGAPAATSTRLAPSEAVLIVVVLLDDADVCAGLEAVVLSPLQRLALELDGAVGALQRRRQGNNVLLLLWDKMKEGLDLNVFQLCCHCLLEKRWVKKVWNSPLKMRGNWQQKTFLMLRFLGN